MKTTFTILFLCRDNSALSIMAEHIMRKVAPEEFTSYSASPAPADKPHPLALAILRKHFDVDSTESTCKSWDSFRDKELDFIVALGDEELKEMPKWLGDPVVAQWHIADPTIVEGEEDERERAFWLAAEQINRRVNLMVSLPAQKLETLHEVT